MKVSGDIFDILQLFNTQVSHLSINNLSNSSEARSIFLFVNEIRLRHFSHKENQSHRKKRRISNMQSEYQFSFEKTLIKNLVRIKYVENCQQLNPYRGSTVSRSRSKSSQRNKIKTHLRISLRILKYYDSSLLLLVKAFRR